MEKATRSAGSCVTADVDSLARPEVNEARKVTRKVISTITTDMTTKRPRAYFRSRNATNTVDLHGAWELLPASVSDSAESSRSGVIRSSRMVARPVNLSDDAPVRSTDSLDTVIRHPVPSATRGLVLGLDVLLVTLVAVAVAQAPT